MDNTARLAPASDSIALLTNGTVAEPYLYRTTDGGVTFGKVLTIPSDEERALGWVGFIDPKHGAALEYFDPFATSPSRHPDHFWLTSDGGVTWVRAALHA
jgi:photosystem II stability/assembly factor-like uncharacterized protein